MPDLPDMNYPFRIAELPPQRLAGQRLRMSVARDRTPELFGGFMPIVKSLRLQASAEVYAVSLYDGLDYFSTFQPAAEFTRWAAVPVSAGAMVPAPLEVLDLAGGLYLIVHYQGNLAGVADCFRHVLTDWLPASPYELDQRPHCAVMGEAYRHDSPESEEDFWIPIRPKSETA